MLEDFYNSNKDILKYIAINQSLYGKYNFAGVHQDEPDPVPNFYIKNRRRNLFDVDNEHKFTETEKEREEYKLLEKHFNEKVSDYLPRPHNLLQVVEVGLEKKYLATNIIAEVLEQIYNQERFFVLNLVDDFNWLFRPSAYHALQYADLKKLDYKMPPYHMALCRLFMKFDGHKIKKGFKVAGTNTYTMRKHNFLPEKINFPDFVCTKITGTSVEGVKNFKQYMRAHDYDRTYFHNEDFMKDLWMHT